MRVIVYLRVSTTKQVDEGISLDAQKQKCLSYCAAFGHEVVETIIDAGASAKSLEREGFQKALRMLGAKEADALLSVKMDRMTRSVKDLCELMERSSREGWNLMSINEHLDTSTAVGRMVMNIMAAVSQCEREMTGERTSACMQLKKERGEFTGGRVPYGYVLSPNRVSIIPDPCEQDVIAEMRRMKGLGMTTRNIAAALTERRVFDRNNNPFTFQDVSRLLSREERT
jgi:site-specific DNA recombinase